MTVIDIKVIKKVIKLPLKSKINMKKCEINISK